MNWEGYVLKIMIKKNNIEQKIEEYRARTGATKTWIAEQLDMSKSRLYQLLKADNMLVDMAIKFAVFLDCDVKDLFEYDIIKKV